MVSEEEIARGVEMIILAQQQNGVVLSLNSVVQQLGAHLGTDLSHKSGFISHHINNLLLRHYNYSQSQQHLFRNDPFALHSHPHFFPPQQQQFVRPHFALQFSGYSPPQQQQQCHVAHPPQNRQHHVTHVTHTQQQHHVTLPHQHVTTPPTTKPKNVSVAKSTQSGTKKRSGSGGLNKLCGVSPELQAIVGEATMARTEIVRQLWAYIRKNNLQDPSNKRKIICDEALRVVLETDSTDMFKMNKLLAKHILPLNPKKSSDSPVPSKRQKLDVESDFLPTESVVTAETVVAAEAAKSAEPSEGESPVSISDVLGHPSEGESPVRISEALGHFLGATRTEMLASEAIEQVHEYVKVHSLEEPSSMSVVCDAKLRELFGCERISLLEMNETLARCHLLQSS